MASNAPERRRTALARMTPQRERPAWRDPGRMSGAILTGAGSSLLVTVLTFIAQHIEVHWR
ncbi:hypothetical protein ATKI12_8762 [Kitasatospora sp. Ki12]